MQATRASRKIPFYSRVGVSELLIIDRDTKDVRPWVAGAGGLAEVPNAKDGWHDLLALAVAFRGGDGVLESRLGNSVQRV
jgi:hypothetical protein